MSCEIGVVDHQSESPLDRRWLERLEQLATLAAARLTERQQVLPGAPLAGCARVEVALVDDAESARVHRDFLGIDGPTDVITFDHGEIIIGVGVARSQAAAYGEPEWRELLRYVVHGLLHLAGYRDATAPERQRMETLQESLVPELWRTLDAADSSGTSPAE